MSNSGEFKIHEKGQLGARDYRFISVYAPPESETSSSLVFFKKIFDTEIIDPEKQVIIAGDWNYGLYSKDYLNYADWINYRPRTRKIIRDGSLEHSLVDPYVVLNKLSSAQTNLRGGLVWAYPENLVISRRLI